MKEGKVHIEYEGCHIVRAWGVIPKKEIDKLQNPIPDITPGIFTYFLINPEDLKVGTVVTRLPYEMSADETRTRVLHRENIIDGNVYVGATIDVIADHQEKANETLAQKIKELSFEYMPYSQDGIEMSKLAMKVTFDDIIRLSGGSFDPRSN